MTNHDVAHAIRKQMSGDVRDAFLAIGECLLHEHYCGLSCIYRVLTLSNTILHRLSMQS